MFKCLIVSNICKQLIKQSVIQYKWTIPAIYSSKQCCVHFSQDSRKTECNNNNHAEILYSQNVNHVEKNAIRKIPDEPVHLNINQAMQVINSLHTYNRNNGSNTDHFHNSYLFKTACNTICKNVSSLQLHEIVHILKTLLLYKVPINTKIIHTLLQLTSTSVNELTLKQTIAIYYALYSIQNIPLVNSILIALPYIFKKRIHMELKTDDIDDLMNILKFCMDINDMITGRYIIKLLANNKRKINVHHIIHITYALCSIPNFTTSCRTLLSEVQKKILNNACSLDFKEIEKLLVRISVYTMQSGSILFAQDVVNALCYALAHMECTFKKKLYILKQLNILNYSCAILLDIIVKECLQDADTLKSCTTSDIFTIIQSFAIATYNPCYWESMENMLKKHVATTDYGLHYGSSVAFLLLSLNCCCEKLIENTFTLLNKVTSHPRMNEIELIALKLHWCLKLLYPEYTGTMIDENRLQRIMIEPECNNTPSIMESLIEAVGGNEYVKHGLQTRFGQFVDYVVVLQENGDPMNVSHYNNFKFVEELASLLNCTKILFFALNKNKYCVNTKNIVSTIKIQLKAIETLPRFNTFIINPYMWETFSKNSKIQHLQEAIKL